MVRALLASGRIQRGIAIENKSQPFRNSIATLAGLPAEVRFADGLAGLQPGEADSLSICGMGGEQIVRILRGHPDRVPPLLVLQPNRRADLIRRWGIDHGFHLVDEQATAGKRAFVILRMQRVESSHRPDPAYDRLDLEAAVLFGPHLIRRWEPAFVDRLAEERDYLTDMTKRSPASAERLSAIQRLLAN
ncbi:tRNA (adenine(22)-N(1))-methyltransferase [Rubripirellula lacrimiformis]|uniref:tRNA (Adenine(22)-N(1))-methyltransferase n=1 Tax=Rubripirellula lacrimiformis TaxID=1930273 RepID=A0A517NGP3_9BACT|nr:tRNA (adenine(22)-N(1))-methyltransferase [Rubripirellula lacrimiformis]